MTRIGRDKNAMMCNRFESECRSEVFGVEFSGQKPFLRFVLCLSGTRPA